MKVSIIIPYHEGAFFLRDCLDSLVEQSYENKEILLICDHVSENDLNLLPEYENLLPIKVFHLEDKTGVAAARNLGLEKASGDYVYFLDSDDYLYGDTIENLVYAALERDDDITYGKKKWTWFQRNVFLTKMSEVEEDDFGDDEDENAEKSPQMLFEHGELDDKEKQDESNDDSDSEENAEEDAEKDSEKEENEERDNHHRRDHVNHGNRFTSYDDDEDEDYIFEENLSPEEREALELQRKEKRIQLAYRFLVSKRRGVRNLSVLNILFKRSFIEEHNLRFPEKFIYFSDVPFLLEAMSKTEKFRKRLSAKYIKRRHNDTVNFPALSQRKDPNRFYEFVDVYYETIGRIPSDSDLRDRFDKKYISYYVRVYAPRLKRSANDIWRNENFTIMCEIVGGMNPRVFKKQRRYRRRLLKALVKRDVKKSIRIVKFHLGYKKLKKITKNKKAFAKFLYVHTFLKQDMKENWVLFESFFGKNYSDSPKYVYEYLAKNYPDDYKFIWVIDKKNTKIPFKHVKIKRFSIRYAYYLARSKYYVFNGRQPDWVRKRKGNIFLQTWHGTPLKKLVFDQEDVSSANPRYKAQVYKQSRAWDYLIAPNAFSSETFRRCFMFDKNMLETGYPRNDILHAPDRDQRAESIRKKLNIPMDKKTILYAPTWRDDQFYAKGQYKFELQLNLKKMKEQLGDEYIILLRTHYFIADSLDVTGVEDFAVNVSKYDDISELYLISDILITDYSSVFFDYANLKRPMLFFTYDLEKYRDVLRGFYIDIEKEVPGPLVFTTEEVIDSIQRINQIEQEYQKRYEIFYKHFCAWEDGHAAEKVVKSVFKR